jgi:hypothetical protein
MRKVLVGLLVVAAAGGAALAAPTKEQIAQAKKLYIAAEAEVHINKFAEAAKDYTAAYELTQDPALLFKIASAHQNAGACNSAVPYYRQYLKDAAPGPKFVALTKERITKCGAPVDEPAATPPTPPTPEAKPAEPPPPTPAVTATQPTPPPEAKPAEPPPPATKPAAPPAPIDSKVAVQDDTVEGHDKDGAWAMAGAAVLLEGAGIVLYAQGNNGVGDGYKDTSYAMFGLGAIAAGWSVYCFLKHGKDSEHTSLVVPTAQPHGGGIAALWRF